MIDFSNLTNVQGNQQRGYSNPGSSQLGGMGSPPASPMAPPPSLLSNNAPPAGMSGNPFTAQPGVGSATMNVMPQNGAQQPGVPSLEAFLKILQGAFSQPGSAAGGAAISPAGSPLPPASPMASLMQKKQPGF